jgi:hypothetical protein
MWHGAVMHVGIVTVRDQITYVSVTLTWHINEWATTHISAAVHSVKCVECLGV